MVMVSASHRFADIHVPKTGGTSRKEAFIGSGVSVIPNLDHAPVFKLIELVPKFDEYYTFSFRRNPLEVAASLFFYWRDGLEEDNTHKLLPSSDFRVWVKTYVKDLPLYEVRELGSHLFYWKDSDGNVAVDDIFLLDDVYNKWPTICAKVGIPPTLLPRLNASATKPSDLSGLYDQESEDIIHSRFEEDYDVLGVPDCWAFA